MKSRVRILVQSRRFFLRKSLRLLLSRYSGIILEFSFKNFSGTSYLYITTRTSIRWICSHAPWASQHVSHGCALTTRDEVCMFTWYHQKQISFSVFFSFFFSPKLNFTSTDCSIFSFTKHYFSIIIIIESMQYI